MPKKTPYILCAFKQPNDQLLQPIYAFGQRQGWLIELCTETLPQSWQGDGVISDYLTLEELAALRDIGKIPVVSRILPPGGNVRSVLSDTRAVARVAVDFFAGQGFRVFASVSARDFPGEVCGIPVSQGRALLELTKRFEVKIAGLRPVEEAIITAGGVKVKDVDPQTKESKLVPGLYFAGELLDVDAYTGGFNLQIAWSTAVAAGMAAGAARAEESEE